MKYLRTVSRAGRAKKLEDEVIARFNPETDEIENLEASVFFYACYFSRAFSSHCRFPRICGGNQ